MDVVDGGRKEAAGDVVVEVEEVREETAIVGCGQRSQDFGRCMSPRQLIHCLHTCGCASSSILFFLKGG